MLVVIELIFLEDSKHSCVTSIPYITLSQKGTKIDVSLFNPEYP